MLTKNYLMTAFTMDQSTFDAVRRLTSGQRLYLDTNVLFSLFGLHGRARQAQAQTMLKRARLQGYEIAVTPWTSKEFTQTIRTARRRIKRGLIHQRPQSLQDARDNRTAQTILKVHARKERDTPGAPKLKEFLEDLERVDYQLALEGVTVKSEGCKVVDEKTEAAEQQLQVLDRYQSNEDGRAKSVRIHDIKHRLLIEHLRGEDEARRISNAGYLLVTYDQSLPRYAMYPDPQAAPFAVDAVAWATRLRQLVPRVENFDTTLALILDTPALHVPELLTNEQIVRVLDRISSQDRFSYEANLRMLLDHSPVPDGEIDPEDYDFAEDGKTEREIALEAKLAAAEEEIAVLRRARENLIEEREVVPVVDRASVADGVGVPDAPMDGTELIQHFGGRRIAAIVCLCATIALISSASASYLPMVGGWALPSFSVAVACLGIGLAWNSNVVVLGIGAVSGIITIILWLQGIHW